QVVAGQGLVLEMGVDQPQAAEAGMAGAGAADVREDQLARVAYDHVLHLTPAVDEHADLPADFPRQFRKMARQLRGDQLPLLHPAAARGEQALAVARLQPRSVSEKFLSHPAPYVTRYALCYIWTNEPNDQLPPFLFRKVPQAGSEDRLGGAD